MTRFLTALRVPPWRVLISGEFWRSVLYQLLGLVLTAPAIVFLIAFPLLPWWLTCVQKVETHRSHLVLPASLTGVAEPWNYRSFFSLSQEDRSVSWRQLMSMFIVLASAIPTLVLVVLWPTLVVVAHRLFTGAGITIVGNDPHFTDLVGAGMVVAGISLLAAALLLGYLTIAMALIQASLLYFLDQPDISSLRRQLDLFAGKQVSLTEAFEAERARIERDLHDGTQQHLSNALIHLGIFRAQQKKMGSPPSNEADERLEVVASELSEAADSLRLAITGLRPRVLAEEGLGAAILELAEKSAIPAHVNLQYDERIDYGTESALYFVVSECLTNTLRHAHAENVQISLVSNGVQLSLVLEDDGVGGADMSQGTGLVGILNRLQLLGARSVFSSPPGGPTKLECTLHFPNTVKKR